MPRIDAFLKLAREQGCSDLHLAVGVPPMLRMNGELMPIRFRDLGDRELEAYVMEILTPAQRQRFQGGEDLDFAYVDAHEGRFRANIFRKATGLGATFRHIPAEIPALETLGLPPVLRELVDHTQGMVLVTGSTGTGKSTTLAALIDHINAERAVNIVSLEDPVEFVHRNRRAQVIQREVGTHVPGYAAGLRAALRQDPDVILVGELRDTDSVVMSMIAAETGHLVLSTLHTTSAVKTIDRILDALPTEQREQGKTFLAQNLHGVVTQTLVKTADGRGRRAVAECMRVNRAIARMIMTDKVHQIPSQMQTGRDQGMQLLDQALLEAIQRGEVDPDDAYRYASDKQAFQRYVTDAGLLPRIDLAGG
ncbi:type IV pilus twitching motility protein PilT [Ectothiorhodospira mobilis]|jgi:twitching motility protein PilT|uniref:Twitching motility protein PilT n=1 Tax=Ectothiorhodospira mobilis TaxID=195064 RepID=A0A1I4S4Z9_ECTMO|nr:PilT/PilU family type 4a pilus ATPase [Ectothiorhodospira mobilis]MCG5534595.1 PilT/PilU family type 4a pilus ATPase [Ectothiorhodospira mobilis]SFM59582.1 twitching motility protein PilT [Ectothiorhodospira mobilis]